MISPHHRHQGQTDHFPQGKLQIFDLYWNQEEGLEIFVLINIFELKFILLFVCENREYCVLKGFMRNCYGGLGYHWKTLIINFICCFRVIFYKIIQSPLSSTW